MRPEERSAILRDLIEHDGGRLLLAYFGEHEPAVADAIRYGLEPLPDVGWLSPEYPDEQGMVKTAQRRGWGLPRDTAPIYRINYPQPAEDDK